MYFETLNEGFFSKDVNMKKNCLPLDLSKTYDNKRIVCVDYNLISEIQQRNNYLRLRSKVKDIFIINAIVIIILDIITMSLSAWWILPLCVAIETSDLSIKLIKDMIQNGLYSAKKFFLFPILDDVENYRLDLIKDEQEEFIKHPVVSINDGEIVDVYDEIRNGEEYNAFKHKKYGNCVVISHNNGEIYSLYANMYHGIKVKIGDKITKGQCIGYVGNTGDSEIPHLHFEIFYTIGTKDKNIRLTSSLSNFEDYMYTPIDLEKELNVLSGKKTNINKLRDPLIKNTSGKIDDCCFIS